MPENAGSYGHGSSSSSEMAAGMMEIMRNVISSLDSRVDFSQFDRVAVVLSGDGWRYALGTVGKWGVWTSDGYVWLSWVWLDHRQVSPWSNYFVWCHEQGHNGFDGNGLWHAGGMTEKGGCEYCGEEECPKDEYGNRLDIMGGGRWQEMAHFSMVGKDKLKLAAEGRIKTVSASETVRLIPRASLSSGIKGVSILAGKSKEGYPKYYMFEYCYP